VGWTFLGVGGLGGWWALNCSGCLIEQCGCVCSKKSLNEADDCNASTSPAAQLLRRVWHRRRHLPLVRQDGDRPAVRGADAPGERWLGGAGCRILSGLHDVVDSTAELHCHVSTATPPNPHPPQQSARRNDTPKPQYGATCWQYNPDKDPWHSNQAVMDFMRKYYQTMLKWLEQGTGPTYKVQGVFNWNMVVWDVQGIHPLSYAGDGASFKDWTVSNMITDYNKRVGGGY